ncbi:MAG: XRE family transcriptional regulator [Bacilli bacterium]|uniref:XRE family transcriptional regulator n=2 Tax=Ureibacillus TaxID=160795 RepID=A0A540UYZ8_9BACL|nr:XRE family transcriptional regulator [Ureibacillus terrenus]MBO2504570.1 Cro/Cl family transcriptional regulator [Bacilli bacterium]MED3661911.1 XRE family transcriptional regulator [Ureibacillus terrenus]MED3765058.1 XRE family transcriptional regulator [Ureibacillus terrenus]TQE89725.1 XRE family transcriptional regulator [Ureibacillus terrenus]
MQIGKKIKALRIKKGLTQEELGERTDLTKGYISQLERDLNSPSIDTLFTILEVLGSTPKEFFDDDMEEQKVVYSEEDQTSYIDEEKKYEIKWLIPTSNDKEMEPVIITFQKGGEYKQFEPSLSETFIYVLKGRIRVVLGEEEFIASEGNSVYYEASSNHQIFNANDGESQLLLVATESYL